MPISNRRLWLTADRKAVVEDGDPRAAFLLVGQGAEMLAPQVVAMQKLDRTAIKDLGDPWGPRKPRPATAPQKAKPGGSDQQPPETPLAQPGDDDGGILKQDQPQGAKVIYPPENKRLRP